MMAAAQKVYANWLEKDSEFCPMDGCPQERLEGSINSNGLICQATEGSPGMRRWRVLQFGWARQGGQANVELSLIRRMGDCKI